MFANMFQMINALPLLVKGQGKVALKRGGYLNWAEFGEVDKRKVKHTILYFHGAPGCRFEPVMHSCSSYDKRTHEVNISRTLDSTEKDSRDNNPYEKKSVDDDTDQKSHTSDVYAQRGIRLICIERPGFGDSTFLENRTVADYVDDVIDLMNSEEICLRSSCTSSNQQSSQSYDSDCSVGETVKSTIAAPNILSSSERDFRNESDTDGKIEIEEKKIYVVGYSAGGPYALAMRSLFEKKQLEHLNRRKSDSKSDSKSESETESELYQSSNVIKIAAVCVVASSVGSAENNVYRKSMEGEMLNFFFSLPVTIQSVLYSGSISAFLGGLKASLFCLSCVSSIITMTDFTKGKTRNKNQNNTEEDHCIETRNLNFQNDKNNNLENIICKMSAIHTIISDSIKIYGGRAMVTDTLAAQWGGRPWGFDLVPLHGEKLPPVLFFYSKEDKTVPPETGIFLCEKTMGAGEPVWLSGGHSCYILHLDKILDELIKYD